MSLEIDDNYSSVRLKINKMINDSYGDEKDYFNYLKNKISCFKDEDSVIHILGIIDNYIYYYNNRIEFIVKFEKFVNELEEKKYTIYNNYYIYMLTFWLIEEENIINSLIINYLELDEKIINNLSIIFNNKTNIYHIIINNYYNELNLIIKSVKKLIKEFTKKSCSLDMLYNLKPNINCFICNKELFCKCIYYDKNIPFSFCRVNKLKLEYNGIRSEITDKGILHFCSLNCEKQYNNKFKPYKLKLD